MIDSKDLKKGDKVSAIYSEGYAGEGTIVPMVIKKVSKSRIVAVSEKDGSEFNFINDDKLSYESLILSRFQHFNLFLGTADEAKQYNEKRENQEEFYASNQELILSKLPHLPLDALKEIVSIIKKY